MKTPTRLIQLIQHIQTQNQQLFASWDAGGDQTLCHMYILDNEGTEKGIWEHPEQKLFGELLGEIRGELNLPNAGEHYHCGKGEIILKNDQEIYIRLNSWEYDDLYESKEEMSYLDLGEYKEVVMKQADRLELIIDCYIGEDKKMTERVEIRYAEGDELPEGTAIEKYIASYVRDILLGYKSQIFQDNGRQLGYVSVEEGELLEDGRMELDIGKHYYDVSIYKGKEVKLFG